MYSSCYSCMHSFPNTRKLFIFPHKYDWQDKHQFIDQSFIFFTNNAQLNSPKNNFKITLKLTLKRSYMFRCKHHLQGAHYSVGEKNKTLIIIKMHGTYVRISKVVLLTRYCAGYKIEKNEMCWACGAYG